MYKVEPDAIVAFRGAYRFLSNFWPAEVEIDGVVYPTTEHAFQAQKTLSERWRRYIARQNSPGLAKKVGRDLELREDWEEVKLDVMMGTLAIKFGIHEDLGDKLLATGRRQLVEGNRWGDTFWGCVQRKGIWVGENHLGRTLMRIRSLLRNEREIGSK
ncbi:MAG: DUF1768 domain-containing protein [Anaerolineae bacterium]|nr:NADAR family protein [Thermoplasmata archaeon]NIV32226.1 DUF1768 domain-containing protein [Anaerolineae bacterium]NIY03678.1 DUF1768 domain-containing protein [Thermoplasmata archaeon]